MCLRMVAPSLVTVTSPSGPTIILSRPLGPREVFRMEATERAARILDCKKEIVDTDYLLNQYMQGLHNLLKNLISSNVINILLIKLIVTRLFFYHYFLTAKIIYYCHLFFILFTILYLPFYSTIILLLNIISQYNLQSNEARITP